MSITDYNTGDQFLFRVRQHWSGNAERYFFNTYEAYAIQGGSLNTLIGLGRGLVDFQATMQYDQIIFDSWAVGTWQPDSHPYNPMTFYTEVLTNRHGLVDSTGLQLMDRDTVLWLARQPVAGQLGKLFLRGALGEGDVTSVAGQIQLSAPTQIQTRLTNAKVHLADYLFLNVPENLSLCMSGINQANQDYVRMVYDIGVRGVTHCKANHRYFDVPVHTSEEYDPPAKITDPIGESTFEQRVPVYE